MAEFNKLKSHIYVSSFRLNSFDIAGNFLFKIKKQ
jgi:hypothetical protein